MKSIYISMAISLVGAGSAFADPIDGPQSGWWQSYSVDFSIPVTSARIIEYGELGRGFRDEFGTLYYADTYLSVECVAGPNCATESDNLIRRAKLHANTLTFSAYWPASYDRCFNDPQPVGLCSEYFGQNYITFLSDDESSELPYYSVTITGGGAIPEPASWAMMIAGFGIVGAAMRNRRSSLAA